MCFMGQGSRSLVDAPLCGYAVGQADLSGRRFQIWPRVHCRGRRPPHRRRRPVAGTARLRRLTVVPWPEPAPLPRKWLLIRRRAPLLLPRCRRCRRARTLQERWSPVQPCPRGSSSRVRWERGWSRLSSLLGRPTGASSRRATPMDRVCLGTRTRPLHVGSVPTRIGPSWIRSGRRTMIDRVIFQRVSIGTWPTAESVRAQRHFEGAMECASSSASAGGLP